jgi:hypothetical protein
MQTQNVTRRPLLFRFLESEKVSKKLNTASPGKGGESNPIEESPRPEPTKKTPWGD